MANTAAPEPDPQRKLTVTFKRKVNIEALGGPKYESAELFIALDDYVPLNAAPEDVVSVLRDMASTVKATVLDEMNLEWEATESGIVVERLRNAFPGAVVAAASTAAPVAQVASAPTPTAVSSVSAEPPYAGQKLDFRTDKAKLAEQKAWAVEDVKANGLGKYWDNRESKPNPRSPDFRHKDFGVSLWVDDLTKAGITLP